MTHQGPRLKHGKADDPAWLGGNAGGGSPHPVAGSQSGPYEVAAAPRSKLPYIIGGVVGVAVIGLIIALATGGDDSASAGAADAAVAAMSPDASASGVPVVKPADKPIVKPVGKPVVKPADKPVVKPADKPADKPRDKPRDKPADKPRDKGGKVTISFLVVPPSATVVVKGSRVRGSITVDKSDNSIPVKVSAPGYKTKTLNLVPSRSRELVLQLLPDEPTIKPPPDDSKEPPEPDAPDLKKPPTPAPRPADKPAPAPAPAPSDE